MASKVKAADPAEDKQEVIDSEDSTDNSELKVEESKIEAASDDDYKHRQERRKDEWGMQFDRWLIRCQQNKKAVLIYLHSNDAIKGENGINAIPKRIDRYYVQFEIDGRDVWINKNHIPGIEPPAN